MTAAAPGVVLPPRRRLRALLLRLRPGVEVGGGVRLGRGVRVRATLGGRVVLEAGSALADGVQVAAAGGTVRVQAGAVLGERTTVVAHESIDIGERAVLGARVAVIDFDHRTEDPERPVRLQGLVTTPVSVGAGAAVGHQAALLRGALVPAAGRVPAGAVVTRHGVRALTRPARDRRQEAPR